MRLCEALKEHTAYGYYPAHMPGHKGNPEYSFLGDIIKYDITEIDGLDNLHDAEGVILESEKHAASLYGVKESHFLVNGSTVGILAAILGVTVQGDKILIGRNCHRSVYNAAEINKLNVRYIYPRIMKDIGICCGIRGEEVDEILSDDPCIKAVIITSPTYEGISSDVSGIAEAAHKHGAVLIVDSAHGAHFGFHDRFPESAASQGADIIINSVHKTLPAPTQTALLHINDVNGVKVDKERVRKQLRIYQSSSPSYLLMAGIDNCIRIMEEHGKELFDRYLINLTDFEKRADKLKHLCVAGKRRFLEEYGIEDADPCKILICHRQLNNIKLYDILRTEYRIQPEMEADKYCLLIMTVMDTEEGFTRIINALECIDESVGNDATDFYCPEEQAEYGDGSYGRSINDILYGSRPVKIMDAFEAVEKKSENVYLEDSVGRISSSYINLYPPGIPVLVPGEEISRDMSEAIGRALNRGLKVRGITGNKEIKVHG